MPFNQNQEHEKKRSFNVRFYLRKHSEKSDTVYYYVTVNGKRSRHYISTGIKIPLKLWDKDQKEIKGNRYESDNLMLDNIKRDLYNIFFEFEKADVQFNADIIM